MSNKSDFSRLCSAGAISLLSGTWPWRERELGAGERIVRKQRIVREMRVLWEKRFVQIMG